MIGKLSGTLLEKNPPQLLVDCHGVGYEVDVPMSTFYGLPSVGDRVALLTHFVVREDAQLLYGFATAAERDAFRQLLKVSGVGPRMALAVLSGMSVTELALAWCYTRWFIASTIIGATSTEQLKTDIDAYSVKLSDEVVKAVNEVHLEFTNPGM